jgi:3-methyladenine DNA glycosylase AlkD
MIDIQCEKHLLVHQIEQVADPAYQTVLERSASTRFRVYGVRVLQLRQIAKIWQTEHDQLEYEELIPLIEALWNGESREEQLLAIYMLERFKRLLPNLTWSQIDGWKQKVDNWELCDALGTWVFGPWIQSHLDEKLSLLSELINKDNIWDRRLALVATIPINRNSQGAIPDITLFLIDQVKGERDPMITKAISWVLRELARKHSTHVANYIQLNRNSLASHILREVDNKLRTGLKAGK